MKTNNIITLILLALTSISLVNALEFPHTLGDNLNISINSNNATECRITTIDYSEGQYILNMSLTKVVQTFIGVINGGNFTHNGIHTININCYDGSQWATGSIVRDVSPTGKTITDKGEISSSIIYFFLFLGISFLFLGFLLLMNKSVWISYFGLLVMLLGGAFLYYDLHLTNLYAQTIAIDSGASNTATGAFVMVARILKLAPYVVVLVVLFAVVRILRESTQRKKSGSDGWDNNQFD